MAVATGSLAICAKLPVPVFGIDEQPGPNGTAALGTGVLLGEVEGLGDADSVGDEGVLGDVGVPGDVGVVGVTDALGGVGVPGAVGSAKAWGATSPRETGRATAAAVAMTV
ncbi:hypothetical protein ACFRKB_33640 [Streptomyces scopuliridis]|uniref:hypothetical protein n=1 Tax=Streptomyces scopuliridis TaxID=452529 RepID=UPI00367ABCCE